MMRIRQMLLAGLGLLALAVPVSRAQDLDPEAIEEALWGAASWQVANPQKYLPVNWEMAPLYDGLLAAGIATGEPAYVGEVLGFGKRYGWSLGRSFYFADDHAVGHAWLDLYRADTTKKARLAPTLDRFNAILANPETRPLEIGKPGPALDRWTWCDALYMGPPTLARLYTLTGEERFLDFMDQEWKYTYDMLWDEEEGLFFRDSRFIPRRAQNGEKIFWSRGNGWVFGGLPLTIPHVPKDRPSYAFYVEVFQKMAAAIAAAQQDSGLWHPSLLDPSDPEIGEASGTAFFVYGFAWGVNNGYLDKATYGPVIEKGWKGLMTRQLESGQVGYVQQVGDRPVNTVRTDHHTYGTGAFLLAGSEILRGLRPRGGSTLAQMLPEAEAYVDAYFDVKRIEGLRVIGASGDDGNVPANAFDGISDDAGNRWSVNGLGQDHYVEVDLGETREISGFVVHTYQNRDYQYKIETAVSPGAYRVAVDRTSNTEDGPVRDELDAPVRARYVKISVTGADDYNGPWVSLQEVELIMPGADSGPVREVPEMKSLRPAPPRAHLLLERNAGWCWFQDERAIIDGDTLVFGTVAGENGHGSSGGDVKVTSVDLVTGETETGLLHAGLNCDDHASPAVYRRGDGRYLAVYSGHSTDRLVRWRVTDRAGDVGSWSTEQTIGFPERVCYSNLHAMGDGTLYNFFRGPGWDPNWMVSRDEGRTWRRGGRLLDWPDRPYVKYASDGAGTVHFVTTDGHPRVFDNSVYHGYVRGGEVHDASGRVVDTLDEEGLREKTLTKIFQGDPHSVGWTVDLELDGRGNPVVALSVQKDGASIKNDPREAVALDHRYYYGVFDGRAWRVNEMAYAGTGLYAAEPDYTGLVAIDPGDTSVVYIASDVHPATGLPNVSRADNRRRYEIFRGETGDLGESWSWTAITRDSSVDNIRPVVPASDEYLAVLWMRGDYRTYVDYGTDIVGVIEKR